MHGGFCRRTKLAHIITMSGEEDTAVKAQANVFPFGQLDKVQYFLHVLFASLVFVSSSVTYFANVTKRRNHFWQRLT